jgi:hypothetical protein
VLVFEPDEQILFACPVGELRQRCDYAFKALLRLYCSPVGENSDDFGIEPPYDLKRALRKFRLILECVPRGEDIVLESFVYRRRTG